MFASANQKARYFTRPLAIFTRTFDGKVNLGIGTFVLLNEDGWILTAAHMLSHRERFKQDQRNLERFNEQRSKVLNNSKLGESKKKSKLKQIKGDPKWITNQSYWWAQPGVRPVDVYVYPEQDFVIARLEGYDISGVEFFPVIKNPKSLPPGTSVCKLGYPFQNVTAEYDEANSSFVFVPEDPQIPLFPIEGIVAREATRVYPSGTTARFIEVTSPGLKGQSGGPIFDQKGTVWGIQVQTVSMPLQFRPTVEIGDGKTTVEHQFLNIGVGVHPEVIVNALTEHEVSFQLSDY